MAKEFKMRPACYMNYTARCSKQSCKFDVLTENNTEKELLYKSEHLLNGKQSLSVKVSTELCGFDKEECHLSSNAKQKILKEFDDKRMCNSASYHEQQIAICRPSLKDASVGNFIKSSEKYLF